MSMPDRLALRSRRLRSQSEARVLQDGHDEGYSQGASRFRRWRGCCCYRQRRRERGGGGQASGEGQRGWGAEEEGMIFFLFISISISGFAGWGGWSWGGWIGWVEVGRVLGVC